MSPTAPLDTRERLLVAAARLIWERSFQATSVDDLCRRAHARKGSFYHFFPSKVDLAVAAIERSWAQTKVAVFDRVFAGNDSGLRQLELLAERLHEQQLGVAGEAGILLGCPFGSLGQEMACQDERIRQTLQTIFDELRAYLEAALRRAETAGEIAPGDHRRRATNLLALLQGAALLAKVANDAEPFRNLGSGLKALAIA